MSSFSKSRVFLICLGLAAALACQSGPQVNTLVEKTPDGLLVVQTVESQATVVAIDATVRTLTLQPRRGDPQTVRVGEGAVNFDQIRVGDTVHVKLIEETVVALISGGVPDSVGEASTVALAPVGAKPSGVVANTVQTTGTVVAIDGHARTITLQLLDGSFKELNVSKDRDLSDVALGDSVQIRVTEALAISVTKPAKP